MFATAFPGKPVDIVVSDLAEAAGKRGSVAMLVVGKKDGGKML